MKIKVSPWFFAIWTGFFLLDFTEYSLCVFLTAFIHEAAHIAVFLAVRAKIEYVKIRAFGAEIRLADESALSYAAEYTAIIAGPGANAVFCTAFFALSACFPRVEGLQFLALSNFMFAATNFLPIFPLDGGRVLYCMVADRYGAENAERAESIVSAIMLLPLFYIGIKVLILTGYNISVILIAVYLLIYLLKRKAFF